jgi:hypothetical protein
VKRLLSLSTTGLVALGLGSTANAAEVIEWVGQTECDQTEEVCLRDDLYSLTFTCDSVSSEIKGFKLPDPEVGSRLEFYILRFQDSSLTGDPELLCSLTFDSDSIDTLEQKCAVDGEVLSVELALEEEGAVECEE